MKLNLLRKRLKILNAINIILVILIIATSIFGTWAAHKEGLEVDLYLLGLISIFLGFVALLIGRFLPTKEKSLYMSTKQKVGLALISVILNRFVPSPSALKGGPFVRSWNFLGFLIMSTITGLLVGLTSVICYSNGALYAAIGYGLSTFLWIILLPFCGFWTYYDSCCGELEKFGESFENVGKKVKKQLKWGTIAFLMIVGVSVACGYFMTPKYPTIPDTSDVIEHLKNVEEMLGTTQSQTEEAPASEKYKTIESALAKIQEGHDNKKMYYRINGNQGGVIYIMSWVDDSDDIYVDTFETLENKELVRTNSFISSSMTKSKMQGQETGVLEEK